MKLLLWLLLPIVVLNAAGYLIVTAARPERDKADEMHVREFGAIPVMHEGRVKPLDTVARVSLMIVSGQQMSYTDPDGKEQPAIRWLLEVMSTGPRRIAARNERAKDFSDPALKLQVFRIPNDQLLGLLGLGQTKRPGLRFSLDEILHGDPIHAANRKEDEPESNFTRLAERVNVARNKKRSGQKLSEFDAKVLELQSKLELYAGIASLQLPNAIPPQVEGDKWQTLADAVQTQANAQAEGNTSDNENARRFAGLLGSFAGGRTTAFNAGVTDYLAGLDKQIAGDLRGSRVEMHFNQYAPFLKCMVLYVGVFLLAVLGWLVDPLGWSKPVWWSAFGLMCVTLIVHTFAIGARIYIHGHPPVTNLYTSAIFIGWAVVVFGLVLEILFPKGIGTAVGAVIGFVTLIIAHHLAMDGDTMEPVRAVLDTNFWLSTHVICVTLGYAATFLAGTLGAVFILLGVFTPVLDRDVAKILGSMIYGVVCLAMLLSFVGTVLGGIWADQSWGRFWGWDPKENGALLIVIWNALVLHARWGGMLRPRGVAVATVFGNIVTSWSWFGVNMLGIGLHAYGFIPAAVFWMGVTWTVHALLIGLGLLPTRFWWSTIAASSRPALTGPRPVKVIDAIVVGQPARG
ncbi:MAG: cytochrome c biogenesis protein CcsA [Planctomycetia bacterium]|nr:cytochrome c biogenesis protein CcsA [Planctomycetia bacterium]